MNEITIAGYFDRDPDQRTIERPTGQVELTKASLNFSSKRGDKEVNMWIDVEAVGDKAFDLASVPQNMPITIKGRLERAAWQDKQSGEWRSKHFIRFENAEYEKVGAVAELKDDIPF